MSSHTRAKAARNASASPAPLPPIQGSRRSATASEDNEQNISARASPSPLDQYEMVQGGLNLSANNLFNNESESIVSATAVTANNNENITSRLSNISIHPNNNIVV